MENKKNFWKGALCGALATFFVATVLIVGGMFIKGKNTHSVDAADGIVVDSAIEEKLEKLQGLIGKSYLHEVDGQKLEDGIYAGYISGLEDPYSMYFDEEDTRNLLESTSGEYSGIGAILSQAKDTGIITIVKVFEESPAEACGLKADDILKSVNGVEVTGEDLTKVVSNIKGKEGSEVKLTILRGESGKEVELSATRRTIEAQTVEYEMKDQNIGYIQVTEFDAVTYHQFEDALNDLETQGMTGLVIDLRSNPGGNLDTVCDMLRLILPKGMIVYTENKDGQREEYTCDGKNEFDKPLTVLVNQYSASASEIFSGAVQDYGIGTIVGTTTYGKGVVQQLYDLKDGTYVKLTISEYFTPNGRNIDGTGIKPDVEIEFEANKEDEKADNQLEKALEIIQNEIK